MASRRTTARHSIDPQTITLNFTKAIQGVTKAQDSFGKNVEGLKELISGTFNELELKLNSKQKELNDLEEKFSHNERSRKLEVDLNIKEHGYEAALDILKERGEVAVPEVTYEELKRMYSDLKASRDSDIDSVVKREQERNNKHIAVIKQTLELQNKAEVAKIQAQLEAQVKQVEVLQSTIERLTKDLDEQRKLTKDVAMASSKQHVYIPNGNNSRN